MTRSRQNTMKAHARAGRRYLPLASAISAVLAGVPSAYAQQQQAGPVGALEEVVVTAQKRSENMQDVPIAILALGTEKLEQLNVSNLDDYVKHLPSVSYSRGQGQGGNGQPGSSHVYMRGVVSGANENHSGSQPSVGTYLDEQPVTTIDGTVDVHVYDIARVEVLEGPQGTLYGASSEAGTIRIITNKPDPTKFSASYDLSLNSVDHGGIGWTAEGYVNLPLSPVAAIRIVAWDEHDGGFIDNVPGNNAAAGIVNGVRTFPTWAASEGGGIGAGSITNSAYVKNHYNTVNTKGGRAAMKLLLGDNWTVTPTAMGQSVDSEGFFGYDPVVGDLKIAHFGPENSQDSWVQTALTIEGKIADLDMVYAGAYMNRNIHSIADYSDYSFFYDTAFASGCNWVTSAGNGYLQTHPGAHSACYYHTANYPPGSVAMPQELVISKGYFQKWSHELRFSTPQQYPVRATFGAFIQRQLHDIFEQYMIPGYGGTNFYDGPGNPNGLAQALSIPTLNNTIWLTDEQRIDRDQAAFAQVTWDMTSQLSAQVGYRYFKSDNTLVGFYGFSANYNALSGYSTGMSHCFASPRVHGDPCTDLDKRVTETGHVPRYNLTYKFTPDKMVYATYSKGFRPGGVNRNGNLGPYQADFLTNYEVGWKTQWLARHLRWNGSFFWEDWKNFQFSFLGPNSLTIITNGASARIKGVESELEWAVAGGLTLSLNGTLIDPRLTANYCGETDPVTGQAISAAQCPKYKNGVLVSPPAFYPPQAPTGTNLPIAPKFKADAVARYVWDMAGWEANVQGAYVYQTQTAPALKTADQAVIGTQPAYGLFDLSAGVAKDQAHWQLLVMNVLDKRAQISRFVQCTVSVCQQPYIIPSQPRTIAIKFGQKF
jgi:iron complex outermembrane receptor protein